jgi:hypothetical protein
MVKKHFVMMVLASVLAVGMAAAQTSYSQTAKPSQKELTFTGRVESVDMKNHTFLVRNDENKNKVEEMKFQFPSAGVPLRVGTENKPIDELMKGDWVTVTYKTENAMHTATSVQKNKKAT